jgi:hypothetical protein
MLHAQPPAAAPAPQVAAPCPRRGSRDCFPETAPRADDGRGSGRIAYPLPPQCNGPAEDPKRCSREGSQVGPAGGFRIEATQWYRVVVGSYEVITDDAGEPIGREFVDYGFNVEVPATYLGLGERDVIEAEAAALYPDKALVDFWTRSAPATEF